MRRRARHLGQRVRGWAWRATGRPRRRGEMAPAGLTGAVAALVLLAVAGVLVLRATWGTRSR
jgi:hypothetical protein